MRVSLLVYAAFSLSCIYPQARAKHDLEVGALQPALASLTHALSLYHMYYTSLEHATELQHRHAPDVQVHRCSVRSFHLLHVVCELYSSATVLIMFVRCFCILSVLNVNRCTHTIRAFRRVRRNNQRERW